MSDKIYCYPDSDVLRYISLGWKIRTVDIAKSNMFCKVQV